MKCNQLDGACNQSFTAATFDELAMMMSKHAREMVQQGDTAHLEAMNQMRKNLTSPDAMQVWMADKRKIFDALPDVA